MRVSLSRCQRDAFGLDHLGVLNARHELARWTGHAGDAAGARDQLAAPLPVREQVLGVEHPDTLGTRHKFVFWTRQADNTASGESLLDRR